MKKEVAKDIVDGLSACTLTSDQVVVCKRVMEAHGLQFIPPDLEEIWKYEMATKVEILDELRVGERLDAAIRSSGEKMASIARKCGVSSPAISRLRKTKVDSGNSCFNVLSGDHLSSIAECLGFSSDWLLGNDYYARDNSVISPAWISQQHRQSSDFTFVWLCQSFIARGYEYNRGYKKSGRPTGLYSGDTFPSGLEMVVCALCELLDDEFIFSDYDRDHSGWWGEQDGGVMNLGAGMTFCNPLQWWHIDSCFSYDGFVSLITSLVPSAIVIAPIMVKVFAELNNKRIRICKRKITIETTLDAASHMLETHRGAPSLRSDILGIRDIGNITNDISDGIRNSMPSIYNLKYHNARTRKGR